MSDQPWRKTACILCENSCGIEVRLDGRRFARIRGDKSSPRSHGYTCERALRLDHHQNGRDRLTSPLLTWTGHREDFAGTPFHKHVPARLEPVGPGEA